MKKTAKKAGTTKGKHMMKGMPMMDMQMMDKGMNPAKKPMAKGKSIGRKRKTK